MKGELETYVTSHGKWTIVEIHSNVRLFGTCEQTYHPTVAEILIKRCILAQSKQYFTSQLVESDIFVKLIIRGNFCATNWRDGQHSSWFAG